MVKADSRSSVKIKGSISESVIRKYHRTPIALYRLKDLYVQVTTSPNFLDSMLIIAALIAFAAAFPFYPLILLAILAVVLFIFTLRHAFLGLIALLFVIFPMLMYQTPALGYVFVIAMTISLVIGYRHYRTIIFALILIPLAFSTLGYIFIIPALIMSVLVLGYKRASVLAAVFVLCVVMISAVTAVQNSAYLLYNAQLANRRVSNSQTLNYSVPVRPFATLPAFPAALSSVKSNLLNQGIVGSMYLEFGSLFSAITVQPLRYFADLIGIIIIVTLVDMGAISSRSQFKGTEASLIGIAYPLLYFGLSSAFGTGFSYIVPLASFLIAPAFMYVLELYRIDIVKALDIRKEDLRLKFGEAFEDLFANNPSEKYTDIGNYEATKMEMKNAIVSPIEQKAISRAYNIKPVKGVLLFGPPGTGKTMLMRAVANDIRAGFFLVKTPDLVSPYPGETERRLENIFATAKKNSPCILFFDEIDAIARKRSEANIDETHRQILSELLIHMDGFQKLNKVVVIGATNVPNLIDPALLRPGRIDRIIYMPLPDFNGRKEIFKIYLKRLPASKSIDFDELAKITERFSGADIKVLCDKVAQEIAQEAAERHKVLEITNEDLKSAIHSSKPSTSLAQVKEYEKFQLDFERRALTQDKEEKSKRVLLEEVIGLDSVKKAVSDAVATPLEHPELVKRYNVKNIKGILMFGPPGNGKTMLMRAITNGMKNITMLELNGADLSEVDPDRAGALIKETFNRAVENAPSILFIDEIDSIAPKRKDATEHGIRLTSEFLQEMDGFRETPGVVLVCATNRPNALDPAILRPGRFDKLIFVEPPDEEHRAIIFENCIKDAPYSKDINFRQLAKESEGFTGADIGNVCREAKSRCLDENISTGKETEVTMEMLRDIIKKTKPSAPSTLLKGYARFLERYGQR